jgi:hypothetical protein
MRVPGQNGNLPAAIFRGVLLGLAVAAGLSAQAYSPKTLLKGQVDASDLQSLAKGIATQAHATTPREKAEAIWRFFLTDGRYVRPGFWYHIPGWAYEEPKGEVLDAMKLLNSYGFGICYHIAPLLEAVYDAAGFEDARVWFLTGHTVTEVFYDGAYHYFDSDMMGYNLVGNGKPKDLPVASVQEIATDPSIMVSKLAKGVPTGVDAPWYPADVKAGAIPDLATLFASKEDNWLFPYTRYSQGHAMDFVLRPGERLIRYSGSEEGIFYLPYQAGADGWREFPKAAAEFNVATQNGPRSMTDNRDWATGRLEYQPPLSERSAYFSTEGVKLSSSGFALAEGATRGSAVFDIRSPYVLIDAQLAIGAKLAAGAELTVETSTDNGVTWDAGGVLTGPHEGKWQAAAKVLERSEHGALNAVTGKYAYLLRLNLKGGASVDGVQITSRFEYNMRTLAPLRKGKNEFTYEGGAARERWELPLRLDQVSKTAFRADHVRYVEEAGNGLLVADGRETAELVFEVAAPDGSALAELAAGGRFLDLRDGLAPEKRTAETRPTKLAWEKTAPDEVAASLEWATAPEGPYRTLWKYDPTLRWKDGKPYSQVLRWPEVDRKVREVPAGVKKLYVRYRLRNMAIDDVRLAIAAARTKTSPIEVTHVWFEDGQERSHVEHVDNPAEKRAYTVSVGGKVVKNYAVIFSCPAAKN